MSRRVRVPVGVLSAWHSVQVEDRIDAVIGAEFDHAIEMLEPFFIDSKGIQLLRVVKEVAVVERNSQCIHAICLKELRI
jgi:hypothetical protein